MKRKQLYEVGVQVSELWVFRVEAHSLEQAKQMANAGHLDAEQICTNKGKPYVLCLGAVKKERKENYEPLQCVQPKKVRPKQVGAKRLSRNTKKPG